MTVEGGTKEERIIKWCLYFKVMRAIAAEIVKRQRDSFAREGEVILENIKNPKSQFTGIWNRILED